MSIDEWLEEFGKNTSNVEFQKYCEKLKIDNVQCLQKVFTPLDFCHILLCYSLNLKWIKFKNHFITDVPKIPHTDKVKTCS